MEGYELPAEFLFKRLTAGSRLGKRLSSCGREGLVFRNACFLVAVGTCSLWTGAFLAALVLGAIQADLYKERAGLYSRQQRMPCNRAACRARPAPPELCQRL